MFGDLFNNKEENTLVDTYKKEDFHSKLANIINNNLTDKLNFLEGTVYDCAKKLHFEWVEGYKIVDKNMCGMNHYQYSLNKEYTIGTIPILSHNGFHFSSNIEDCICNKGLFNNNRIFKVKAFVLSDDSQIIHTITPSNHYSYGKAINFFDTLATNILVASKIILYEEISTKDILDITKEIYPFVNSFEFDEVTTYKNLIQNEIMKIYDNKDLMYLFKCVYKPANAALAKMDFYKIKMHTIVEDDNGKKFMNEFLTSCIREVRCY